MTSASTNAVIDGGVLLRVARSEDGAMKDCIDRFGGLVWSLISRYVPSQSDAEDVVQEVFTELWKSAGRYNPERASEATFIGLIARRRGIDWVRKRTRQPSFEVIDEEMAQPERASACGPFDADRIALAMQKLPEDTRRLFALHFTQGMTHPEIAAETGLPIGTVKTKLRRGLVAMRASMREPEAAGNE